MEIFKEKKGNMYQVFGSKSSVDLDVCFFVEKLSSIEENHKKVQYCIEKSDIKSTKKINANLAILDNGIVTACFKGEKDELNNALFRTYDLHQQKFKKQVKSLVERDLDLRVKRCLRSLVSYFTRTVLREEAKKSLKGNSKQKIDFLVKINLKDFTDFGKNGSKIEVFKSIAFQLGITLALIDGVELYTKEDIINRYPKLEMYLLRKTSDSLYLSQFLQEIVEKLKR